MLVTGMTLWGCVMEFVSSDLPARVRALPFDSSEATPLSSRLSDTAFVCGFTSFTMISPALLSRVAQPCTEVSDDVTGKISSPTLRLNNWNRSEERRVGKE